MINVTRLNDQQFVLNADLIRTVEANPDTIITLVNGGHFIVKESMPQVVERAVEYGRSLKQTSAAELTKSKQKRKRGQTGHGA